MSCVGVEIHLDTDSGDGEAASSQEVLGLWGQRDTGEAAAGDAGGGGPGGQQKIGGGGSTEANGGAGGGSDVGGFIYPAGWATKTKAQKHKYKQRRRK